MTMEAPFDPLANVKAKATRTAVLDVSFLPKITIWESPSAMAIEVEVEGIEPQRTETAEERSVGIRSLAPPTVIAPKLKDPRKTHRRLIDGAVRATQCAVTSTLGGDTGGPVGLLYTAMRVSMAVRWALRRIGHDPLVPEASPAPSSLVWSDENGGQWVDEFGNPWTEA
jgi:hypothetical protein